MVSPETMTPSEAKPFQFRLRSIFLATAAVGMALGLLKWLGPVIWMILAVQSAAIIAVLVKSRRTALRGVVFTGLVVAVLLLVSNEAPFDVVLVLASFSAWFAGTFAADAKSRKESRFVRWASALAALWIVFIFFLAAFVLD